MAKIISSLVFLPPLMLVKPEIEQFAKIRVVGVGGAGTNAVNNMVTRGTIKGVDFVCVNTDVQSLTLSKAQVKIQIGKDLTKGLGSGGNPEVGRKAAEESLDLIRDSLEGSDMVFITAGLGGGTGTGATPIIASIAKSLGALTVGVVTKPFEFEGVKRMENANIGHKELKEKVDALITIPNQKLLDVADQKMSLLEAFGMADGILGQGVQGISDLIVVPGLVNVDFADVKTIMTSAGSALMGIGSAEGENRAEIAAQMAISSPLLEVDISGATGILFNIVGGLDLSMHEIDKAAKIISSAANPDANIIFGAAIDESMGNSIKITVIATGFDMEIQDAYKKVKELPSDSVSRFDAPQGPSSDGGLSEEDTKYDIPTFLRRSK